MTTNPIDLRSDTVTQPTPAMLQAIADAQLGDDVLEGDPTVRELEQRTAEILGKEDAVFVPSGTMANLVALLSMASHGDEIIADAGSHVLNYESAAYAAVAGLAFRPVESNGGVIAPDALAPLVRADDPHFPRSRIALAENTNNAAGGAYWHVDEMKTFADAAHDLGLLVHIDGARLWNACAATGAAPAEFAACADTVSVCFSKGLGAPVGSAMASTADRVALARRKRKMLGGAMRQSGLLAAGALHALDYHIDRLPEDHARAARLADAINNIDGLTAVPTDRRTNMVYFEVDPKLGSAPEFCKRLAPNLVVLPASPTTIRAVLHLHIDDGALDRSIEALRRASR